MFFAGTVRIGDAVRRVWNGRYAGIFRAVMLPAALLIGALCFGLTIHSHYPIQHWLVWMYAVEGLLVIGWMLACVSAGHLLLRWLAPPSLPLRERLVFSMGVGTFLFVLATFVAGVLGALGGVFAVALPVVMLAAGIVPLGRTLLRARRKVRALKLAPRPGRRLQTLVLLSGLFAVLWIYVGILHPENIAYDARWYHLPIAEHFAAEGAIRPSPEGWFNMAMPHFATLLYTWAMALPALGLFERLVLSSHIEFVLFLWTLGSIPVAVRWVFPGARVSYSWVAFFLFPSIFLYDGALGTAADHVLAFWAVPIFLALRLAWRELHVRPAVLLGIALAGAWSTKFQGAFLMTFPIAAITLRALWLTLIRRRPRALLGLAAAGALTLLLTTHHWLRNYLWYGAPLYPFGEGLFEPRPWTPDTALRLTTAGGITTGVWRPVGTFWQQVWETLKAFWTFSFIPHDWAHFHRNVPVFGSMFTLCLAAMPFLRGTRRLWALYAYASVSLLTWYWVSHQDRYLQGLLPLFVACVAGTFVAVWRAHRIARVALGVLTAVQLMWASYVVFIPAHVYVRAPPVRMTMALIASAYHGHYAKRYLLMWDYAQIGRELPRDAKVLVHEEANHLGLQRMSVQDLPGWQGGISYGRTNSPGEMYDLLRGMGVTHVTWISNRSTALDTYAGDLRFHEFATDRCGKPKKLGSRLLAAMPPTRPADPDNETVAYVGCQRPKPGLYEIADLAVNEHDPKATYPAPRDPPSEVTPTSLAGLVQHATFVIESPGCPVKPPKGTYKLFKLLTKRGAERLWVRRRFGLRGAVPKESPGVGVKQGAPGSEPARVLEDSEAARKARARAIDPR